MIGRTTDGDTGESLAGVTLVVTLRSKKFETAISDENGCFTLPSENAETLTAYYLDLTREFPLEAPSERVIVKDIVLRTSDR